MGLVYVPTFITKNQPNLGKYNMDGMVQKGQDGNLRIYALHQAMAPIHLDRDSLILGNFENAMVKSAL